MRGKITVTTFFIFLLAATIVYASSISISAPSIIEQGKEEVAHFEVTADTKFSGFIYLKYSSNLYSLLDTIEFTENNFTGVGPYTFNYSWIVKGITVGEYYIFGNITDVTSTTLFAEDMHTGMVNSSIPQITETTLPAVVNDSRVEVGITTNENCVCKGSLDSDVEYEAMSLLFSGDDIEHNYTLTGLDYGEHTLYVRCQDSIGNTMDNPYMINFTVNLPPQIKVSIGQSSSSEIIRQSQVNINVTTNKNATCRYDTVNTSYSSMEYEFSGTGTGHSVLLELDSGDYTYYVLCKDTDENLMDTSVIVSFTVDLPPTAEITLSEKSPVKVGTIEVTLLASEKLQDKPSLKYSFNDAPSSYKPVSLTGSGNLWKGYMIISANDDNKVGTFEFSGKDSIGNIGTVITEGSIFTVDTTKPQAVKSIRAVSDINGRIKLSWYYDGEEVDHYNIYRSTITGVDYVDFYAESENGTTYIDSSTDDKVTYYYKVSAVDKAGNEGMLSGEVYATAVGQTETEGEEEEKTEILPKVLPPNLVPKVDESINRIESLTMDIDRVLSDLEGSSDSTKKGLIKEFQVIDKINSAKTRLENLKMQLENLKSKYMDEAELTGKLRYIELEMKKIKKTAPKDIKLEEKAEFVQSIGEPDVLIGVNEFLTGIDITEKDKEMYTKKNVEAQKDFVVEVKVRVISIEHIDGSSEEKTSVEKKIVYNKPEPVEEVVVIEIIPKSAVESASEIEFITDYNEIIKDDPIIQYGFLKLDYLGGDIRYTINKKAKVDDVKKGKTIPLLSIATINRESTSQVTGFSIASIFGKGNFSITSKIFVWSGIILISVLLVYYFVFVKRDRNLIDILPSRLPLLRRVHRYKPKDKSITPNFSLSDIKKYDGHIDYYLLLSDLYHRLSNAKEEIRERLSPFMSSIRKMMESRDNKLRSSIKEMDYINYLISEAEECIENNEYNRASILYPEIKLLYKKLPKELKVEVYDRCVEIQTKIEGIR
jgi:hypothetical protein